MSQPKVLRQKLFEKLADLPEARFQEVLDFIDFLRSQERKADDPILKVAGCLSGHTLSAKQIEDELYELSIDISYEGGSRDKQRVNGWS